jgi:hypothetical protein
MMTGLMKVAETSEGMISGGAFKTMSSVTNKLLDFGDRLNVTAIICMLALI